MEKTMVSEGWNLKEMTAEELVADFEKWYGNTGLRDFFFYNGKPFTKVKVVDLEEDGEHVLFRATTNSLVANFCQRFWEGEEKRTEKVEKSKIVGYEMVDVYSNGKYVGTFRNVVVK